MNVKAIFPMITEEQTQQLEQFCSLIGEWNRRINLVSRQDVEQLWEHHILPSIIVLKIVDIPPESRVLDIGSGGGLPAIPLGILRPDLQILMVDSIRKKKLFLQTAISELKLNNISVINARVETLGQQTNLQQKFDRVTARAVGAIENLLSWGKPFLKPGGGYLLWKGSSDIAELKTAAETLNFFYRVLAIPEPLQQFSSRFKELRFLEIL